MSYNLAWSEFVGRFGGPGSLDVTLPIKLEKYIVEKFGNLKWSS